MTNWTQGAAAGTEQATPGSYGEPPPGFRLPASTSVGAVRLQIANLARSLAFYQEVLGLRVVADPPGRATLAASGDDCVLIDLVEVPGTQAVGRLARLGLYHFAILLPDRSALGRLARHLSTTGVPVGAGDHLVSEALYVSDPDGLGIEVYADRPRSAWRRVGRELQMATDAVDVPGLVEAAGDTPWTGMPAGTAMGHVHLRVGDIARAASFYADALGFDRTTWRYPGALFLGAGGYHHHVGVNTWAGPDAKPAGPGEARLLEWTLTLPDAAGVQALESSLVANGYPSERDADTVVTRDPWDTAVRVRAR